MKKKPVSVQTRLPKSIVSTEQQPLESDICPACGGLRDATEKEPSKGRPPMFPLPSHLSDGVPVTFRTNPQMVRLFNEEHASKDKAENFSAQVQQWCTERATALGWDRVYFPLAFPLRTMYAGAVFVKTPVESQLRATALVGRRSDIKSDAAEDGVSPPAGSLSPRRSKRVS